MNSCKYICNFSLDYKKNGINECHDTNEFWGNLRLKRAKLDLQK